MAVATLPRQTTIRNGDFFNNVPLAAGVIVPTGTVAALSSAGVAGPSSPATYNVIIGVVDEGADNTGGASGAKVIQVARRNISCTFENSSTAAVTAAHIGLTAKWEDNQTVCAPATASLPSGGIILGINSDLQVEIAF